MKNSEIIAKAEWNLMEATFSDPIVNTSKPVQNAIEMCDAPLDTMRNTECLVTFNNAYRLFYKRLDWAYETIKIKNNLKINAQ